MSAHGERGARAARVGAWLRRSGARGDGGGGAAAPAKQARYAPADWAPIAASRAARDTSNPIRKIVDQMMIKPETDKPPIPLSIGDPCTDGNLLPPAELDAALQKAITEHKHNGYPPSAGVPEAREAVAKRFPGHASHPCTSNDVFIASGASHALQMAFDALLNPGDNILLPQPGFSLYKTICDSKGYQTKWYNLRADAGWECDLDSMRAQIDSRTRAIFINNPSNPCGSNFSRAHVEAIVRLAEEARLPLISDEIYADMAFAGGVFTSAAAVSERVPVLVVGGIAKQYVVPGWRLGWVVVHDRAGLMAEVRTALLALSTIILGPCSVVQAAVPAALFDTPQKWYDGLIGTLGRHAEITYDALAAINGLTPVRPQGAMYVMVGIDMKRFPGFQSEVEFSRELLREQAVMVLPGSVFGIKDYFRVVFTKPEEKLREAYARIAEFCAKHRDTTPGKPVFVSQ